MTEKQPEIIVFAGPDGSGKSTYTQMLLPKVRYINADEIKKNLQCSALEAAQLAEEQRHQHLNELKDFAFETVLSTEWNLLLLKKAKELGYFIRCYYIITSNPNINIYRINNRVRAGGHPVPKDKIVSRYYKALALIQDVVDISDICHIYDNSTLQPFRFFKKT